MGRFHQPHDPRAGRLEDDVRRPGADLRSAAPRRRRDARTPSQAEVNWSGSRILKAETPQSFRIAAFLFYSNELSTRHGDGGEPA